jgi:hypothetical protein
MGTIDHDQKIFSKNMKFQLFFAVCAFTIFYVGFAHDIPVHRSITYNAAQSAQEISTAYAAFIGSISQDLSPHNATNEMIHGSAYEDNIDVPNDLGGKRSLNHFYDPLDGTFGKGLSDRPTDTRLLEGLDSFTWASVSNCVGYNFNGSYGFGKNLNTLNQWSWQNARGYEWIGLSASNQNVRTVNLAYMFRAVGQVMHLLEDTSQPQHVRNEQHYDVWPTGGNTPWRSFIEDYGESNVATLNYQHAVLDWRGDGFVKLQDFWDRHLYNGSGTPLAADVSGGANTLGLAEWCNGNFLGQRHLYRELFARGNICYYPFPSIYSTDISSWAPSKDISGAFIDTEFVSEGISGSRVFLRKLKDGVSVSHHSVLTYTGVKYPLFYGQPTRKVSCSITSANVMSDYHAQLIPKAVQYSAGLLDYFFRGTLKVTIALDGDAQFTNTVLNTSGENFHGGTFYLFQDDTNENRTLICQTNLAQLVDNGILTNGTSVNIVVQQAFTNGLLLVYQGDIGYSNGAANDPVDAGIAISATKLFTNLPIAWWPADGNSRDYIGGHDGDLENVSYTPGQINQAFAFDPEDDDPVRIRVPDDPAFVLTNALSIEGWVRPRGDGYLIFYRGDSRYGDDPYTLSMQGNSIIAFSVCDDSGTSASVQAQLTYNQWAHVAGVYDHGKMMLYINGVLASQGSTGVVPIGELIADDDPGIGIGNTHDEDSDFPFYGDIDQISLYSYALTADQIHAIYQAGVSNIDYW